MSTAFLWKEIGLRFEFQTEECTHNINSVLCIKDVRKDGETVAEENDQTKAKNFVEYISFFFFFF